MELRLVDPKSLKDNPNNPRLTPADLAEDRRLAMNIKVAGLVHPPTVREIDGELVILAGHRRRRAAIKAGLKLIPVCIRTGDEHGDALAAASENMIRTAMTEPDQWAAVRNIRASRAIKDADLCRALMITPAQLKRLELFASLHPPILDAINRRMAPTTQQLQIIAAAHVDDQSAVWGNQFRNEPEIDDDEDCEADEDGEGDDEQEQADTQHAAPDEDAGLNENVCNRLWPIGAEREPDWRAIAHALTVTCYYARDARFDDAQGKAAGITWTEDLFAEGDQDSRYTDDAGAYETAQQAWLAERVAEGSEVFGMNTWNGVELPEGYLRVQRWMSDEPDDRVGFVLHPHSLKIEDVTYRIRPIQNAETDGLSDMDGGAVPATRPDLSKTGHQLIGERRTVALHAALDAVRDTADPWDLVAGLLLALTGTNVSVSGDSSDYWKQTPSVRKRAAYAIAPEGDVVRDPTLLRGCALDVLKAMSSCAIGGQKASGISALILGRLFHADDHLPGFADEEFLKTYSKPGITKLVQGVGILPRNTGKEMRTAMLSHIGQAHWVPEIAGFGAGIAPWLDNAPAALGETDTASDDEDTDEEDTEHTVIAEDGPDGMPRAAEAATFMREHLEVIVVR